MADVACPSGYTQVIEDVVYTSYGDSCPNGDTKLGGEYGEDSILNCIGAQSGAVPICTYFAESCQPGMSFDGQSHQSCPSGSYCDGTGTATPGVAGCTQTCPLNSNSRSGATSVTDCTCNDGYYMNNGVCETCPAGYACSGGEMTQCENGTYSVAGQSICTSCPPVKNVHGAGLAVVESVNAAESIDACEAVYMFMSQYIVQLVQQYEELPTDWDSSEYNPDSDANKRGFINVYCKYDAKSQDYVADCNSHVWSCEGGYYADDSGQEGAYPPSYTSNTLDDIIKNSCRPVGENYWSPSYSTYISGPDDNMTFDEAMTLIYDKYPCPENSSTRGDTTAAYCTCNDGYTVTGTIGGSIQTTTNACIKFMCEDGYYQNGNTCEICPVGSYCANNTKTACDTGYTTDNTGATSESQCYTTCTKQCTQQTCPENATCTHGTTTTAGKQYVGSTCNAASSTCEMTVNCNNGYDKQDGEIVLVSQTPLVPVDYMDGGDSDASINAGGNLSGNSDFGLTESNTWAAHFEHGTVYGRASCQPDADAGAAYVINYNTLYDVGTGLTNIEDFETKLAAISGEAKAKYMADAFRGLQDGTITDADFGNAVLVVFGIEYNASYSTTDNGQYCYCQMTEYSPTNESKQSVVGNWVYLNDFTTSGDCANKCANMCANGLRFNETPFSIGLRAAVFDSMRAENTAVCVAKTIDVPAGYYLPT